MNASMRMLAATALVLCSTVPRAQDPCPHGSPEESADALAKALQSAPSCASAAKQFSACRWGSSADSEFGAIAVKRCEQDFYGKLSTAAKNNYADKMQLCAYQYSREQGTMSISAAASCQVDLAASIAADRHAADEPIPRASFDCSRAESSLEKAICSDVSLGRADVVLARVYATDLKLLKDQERTTLMANERNWLNALPAKCGLRNDAASRKVLNCLRNAFEIRFSSLDSCVDDEPSACLNPDQDPQDYRENGEDDLNAPRASFDCNTPNTALQLVICDDHALGNEDVQLAKTFAAALAKSRAAERPALEDSERKWTEFVMATCPLGPIGGAPPVLTRACVRSAFEVRIRQIGSCSSANFASQVACLNRFSVVDQ